MVKYLYFILVFYLCSLLACSVPFFGEVCYWFCLFICFFLTLTWISRLLPTFVDFDERKRLLRDLCSRKAIFKDMDEVSGGFSKCWVDFLDSNLPVNN